MDNKWKQHLLKSGLPLEFIVAQELSSRGHEVFGEYPYVRPDEKNERKEFSVDVRTHAHYEVGDSFHTLSLLVECKYRTPGTVWMFAPLSSNTYAVGLIHDTSEVAPVRFHGNELSSFEDEIGYCVGGVEISPDSGANREAVRHGLAQLRFAMPVLFAGDLQHALQHPWSNGRHVSFCCPLLVTTAELRCLKKGLALDDFHQASSLDEISEVTGAIVVNEEVGPQLQTYADEISSNFAQDAPKLKRRLSALGKVLVSHENQSRMAPDLSSILRSIAHTAERVLVVNLTAFPALLEKLGKTFESHLTSEKVYGTLEYSDGELALLNTERVVVEKNV
jgi:hypothetical protein